jgi:hypothetical protein
MSEEQLKLKSKACTEMIEKVNAATCMSHRTYDENKKEVVTIREEIPEGIKEMAVRYLSELASSEYKTYTIYHGQDDSADYIWYLSFEGSGITMKCEIDYGMKHHDYYKDPEEILYAVDSIEDAKTKLQAVDTTRS